MVSEARKTLFQLNWRELFFERYPEYNTADGGVLLANVWLGRSSDVRIAVALKLLAQEVAATEVEDFSTVTTA
jgi:hypothetical protein